MTKRKEPLNNSKMNKLLYSLFAVLALSLTFVACSDDDDDDSLSTDVTPEIAAAGVYSGTWTRIYSGDTLTAEGTMTVTATDSAYCADFAYYCADFDLDVSSVANISYAGSTTKFYYVNASSDGNGLGANFAGKIIDGEATAMFTITQKVGRTSYSYAYTFAGSLE